MALALHSQCLSNLFLIKPFFLIIGMTIAEAKDIAEFVRVAPPTTTRRIQLSEAMEAMLNPITFSSGQSEKKKKGAVYVI